MEKLQTLFKQKKDLLSVYFTAGFPNIDSTLPVLKALEEGGADFVEIGMPYSDPLADGPVIQNSSTVALKNGMSLKVLFEQLKELKKSVKIPMILMGYFNPVLKFGVEAFIEECKEVGISGLIIPDLPYETYIEEYEKLFTENGISNIFLITPQTPDDRIKKLNKASTSFIYMVSSAAVTGARNGGLSPKQVDYFERVNSMELKTPCMVGFGISNHQNYKEVCNYAHGAIVGSAFIKHLENIGDDHNEIVGFIKKLKNGQ
ncbi:tryptophan synthase subunit alpha [Marinilabilia rubra]|uniref:Tryptophan synthase alpha chain n=1 Tax=Marinilabilia rubra TaxID=2162893 RepID=A0A2U2BDV4_9BACT|nr:tryptophan synthase subunit alpha [Marinilabilia rubra]PWE01241.1 tryptophan synthase subunit alpha [Marinilabilia rubra]